MEEVDHESVQEHPAVVSPFPSVSVSSPIICRKDGGMMGGRPEPFNIVDLTLDEDSDEDNGNVDEVSDEQNDKLDEDSNEQIVKADGVPGEIKVLHRQTTSSDSVASSHVQQPDIEYHKAAFRDDASSDSSSTTADDSTEASRDEAYKVETNRNVRTSNDVATNKHAMNDASEADDCQYSVAATPVQQPGNEAKAAFRDDSSDSSSSQSDNTEYLSVDADGVETNETNLEDHREVEDHQYTWIKPQATLHVHHKEERKQGGGDIRDATAIGPVHKDENGNWVVKVKWHWEGYGTGTVECSKIVRPDEKRKRRPTTRFSPYDSPISGIDDDESQEERPKKRKARKSTSKLSQRARNDDTAPSTDNDAASQSPLCLETKGLPAQCKKAHTKAPGGVLSVDDQDDDFPLPKRLQNWKEEHRSNFKEMEAAPNYKDNTLDPALTEENWLHILSQSKEPDKLEKEAPRFERCFSRKKQKEQRLFQRQMNHFFDAHPELNQKDEADLNLAKDCLMAAGYPFSLQQATKVYREDQQLQERIKINTPIYDGLKVIKRYDGQDYEGTVVDGAGHWVRDQVSSRSIFVWKVCFTDQDQADLTYEEIMKYRKDNPRPSPQKRPLRCLELFAGQCVVSQAFITRNWEAVSVDILKESNASLQMDLMDFDVTKHLHYVPDFIWCSPPCQTYSRAAGNLHRGRDDGELSKSTVAHEHDALFTKMMQILRWVKARHPHVIICIENPVGKLQKMPLMAALKEQVGLCDPVTIHYCAFGREELKPTHIWTNDPKLRHRLSEFTCERKCTVDRNHLGVQGNTSTFDFSAIPEYLADFVARYVDARFFFDEIQDRDAVLSSM